MKLTNYVEEHIFKGKIFTKIFASQQAQIDKLNNDLDDLLNQAFICSATWGLKYWENELNIIVDETDSYENRRSRCFAQIRGTGNCTIDYMKQVALSYQCGDIEIIEDFENYRFTVKFVNKRGIPEKIDDLKKTLRLISPAHLDIEYEFNYLTWGELKEYRYGELLMFSWQEILEGKIYHNNNWYTKSSLVTEDNYEIVTGDGFGIQLVEF